MAKRINIRPTTSVYATYKNIRYDPWTAIAEFVDNSTQSYYDNTEKLNSTKYWNGLAVDIEYKRDKVSGDHLIISMVWIFEIFSGQLCWIVRREKNLAVSLEWD